MESAIDTASVVAENEAPVVVPAQEPEQISDAASEDFVLIEAESIPKEATEEEAVLIDQSIASLKQVASEVETEAPAAAVEEKSVNETVVEPAVEVTAQQAAEPDVESTTKPDAPKEVSVSGFAIPVAAAAGAAAFGVAAVEATKEEAPVTERSLPKSLAQVERDDVVSDYDPRDTNLSFGTQTTYPLPTDTSFTLPTDTTYTLPTDTSFSLPTEKTASESLSRGLTSTEESKKEETSEGKSFAKELALGAGVVGALGAATAVAAHTASDKESSDAVKRLEAYAAIFDDEPKDKVSSRSLPQDGAKNTTIESSEAVSETVPLTESFHMVDKRDGQEVARGGVEAKSDGQQFQDPEDPMKPKEKKSLLTSVYPPLLLFFLTSMTLWLAS